MTKKSNEDDDSVWRGLARMEAEVHDPDEDETIVYQPDELAKIRDAAVAEIEAAAAAKSAQPADQVDADELPTNPPPALGREDQEDQEDHSKPQELWAADVDDDAQEREGAAAEDLWPEGELPPASLPSAYRPSAPLVRKRKRDTTTTMLWVLVAALVAFAIYLGLR